MNHWLLQWLGGHSDMAIPPRTSHTEAEDYYRVERPRPPAPYEIHVAIFCALSLEADAVDAVFDKHWKNYHKLYSKAHGDSNAYTLGSMGPHNVVLVHLSGMGNVASATAAAQCRCTFPFIQLALVVGVCGAAPSTPGGDEIILGDAMISDGVIQYDLGRQFPTRFERKRTLSDSLGRPNVEIRSLLARLSVIRRREELEQKAGKYLEGLQSQPHLSAQYPGVDHDRLFDASYRHIGESNTSDEVGCSGQPIMRHRHRRARHQPAVRFGTIASGDTVMKSGEACDSISRQEGVIAFEMESAGIWDFFPCIVIKSACDYADSHKSKMWQPYAAATAAAYMRALLDEWAPSSTPTGSGVLASERLESHQENMHTSLGCAEQRIISHIQTLDMSISETPIAASNPYNLGQIVRAELRRQLRPFSDNFGRVYGMIDRIATSVSNQSNDQDIFDSPTSARTQTVGSSHSLTKIPEPNISISFPQGNLGVQESSVVLLESTERPRSKSRTVSLFSTCFHIQTVIGILIIRVTSYRIRNDVIHQGGKYFRLAITFVPRSRLCLHGMSIAYSSGPDNTGYYDIFPRIQTFSVVLESSPLWGILAADDLPVFIRMLQDRKLSLRDRTPMGDNILYFALREQSLRISQYLLHESGHEELAEDVDNSVLFSMIESYSVEQRLSNETAVITRNVARLSRFEGTLCLIRQNCLARDVSRRHLHDHFLTLAYYCRRSDVMGQDAIWLAQLFQKHFGSFQSWGLLKTWRVAECEYRLKVYFQLGAGADPNLRDEQGRSPLHMIMQVIGISFLRRRPVGKLSECMLSDGQTSYGQDVKDEDDRRCIRLLTLLISAGADIYEVVLDQKRAMMLTELASESGIREMWETALGECGFVVQDVYAESERRTREYQRLQGAERTGVDVEVLQEHVSSTGLRHRARRNVTGT